MQKQRSTKYLVASDEVAGGSGPASNAVFNEGLTSIGCLFELLHTTRYRIEQSSAKRLKTHTHTEGNDTANWTNRGYNLETIDAVTSKL